MKQDFLDLYTDDLISGFSSATATATGLSSMVSGAVSHDQVTRFLSERDSTSRDLWFQVKSTVREIEQPDAVLIFDDTIQEKPWTDERELICWHFDYCQNRTVKGVNLLNALYDSDGVKWTRRSATASKSVSTCPRSSPRSCDRTSWQRWKLLAGSRLPLLAGLE